MKRNSIERQTLFVTLVPLLVMAVLLESYFVITRFADMDRALQERSQLLAHQLAASCEYAVFSGNGVMLKQNVDAAFSYEDVMYVGVQDAKSRLLLESGKRGREQPEFSPDVPGLWWGSGSLRLYEPILATQINIDGFTSAPAAVQRMGAVVLEISKQQLNSQKQQFLLVSMLVMLLVFTIALVLALHTARRITHPIVQIHHAVRRIGEGDLETQVKVTTRIREINELAAGIEEMTQHLLRDRDMLENRIVETTDGLRLKNKEVEQIHQANVQLNENLDVAMREMQAIMEANPDLLYVFNNKAELVQWNSSFARFFGKSPERLRYMHLSEFICEEERETATKRLLDVFTRESVALEVGLLRHDGVTVPYLCNGVVLRNANGEVSGFTGTGRDISDRKATLEQMHRMAHFDVLTGLPNRALLSERLQYAISLSKRNGGRLALMFLDLDMFKFINDKFGHDVGDLLLKDAARRIQECVRETDTASRFGGDEFVVLLPSIESTEVVLKVAEKIRKSLCEPFEVAGHTFNISTSIGVAIYPEHGADERQLLKNADTAMYLAKKHGRNTVIIYTS